MRPIRPLQTCAVPTEATPKPACSVWFCMALQRIMLSEHLPALHGSVSIILPDQLLSEAWPPPTKHILPINYNTAQIQHDRHL